MNVKLCKFFLLMIILYSGLYMNFFQSIPNMMSMLGICMLIFLLFSVMITSAKINYFINSEIIIWIIFGFICLFTAMFTASNLYYATTNLFKYFQNIMLIVTICYISKYDGKCDFIINIYYFYTLLFAIVILVNGYDINGRIEFINMSANSIGITMFLGTFCVLYKANFKHIIKTIISIASICLFGFVIILTGSRKALIAFFVCIIYWIVFCLKKYTITLSVYKKFTAMLVVISMIFAVTIELKPVFKESNMYDRIVGEDKTAQVSDEIRKDMYKDAMQYFESSPVFGIGYKNYELVSKFKTYTHSTYAELLACTGIIGFLMYNLSLLIALIKTIIIITDKNLDFENKNKAKLMLIMLSIMIFLGFGVIHFYDIHSSIVFGMIFGFTLVNSKSWRKNKNEQNEVFFKFIFKKSYGYS